MPITPFLQGQAFGPESTQAMGVAFEKACRTLGLMPTSDLATEHVARIIIMLAQRGERDAERLYKHALAYFERPMEEER